MTRLLWVATLVAASQVAIAADDGVVRVRSAGVIASITSAVGAPSRQTP
jgi:hypothetical protein